MGEVINWADPIETVPDSRNPEPVACRYAGKDGFDRKVLILGDWFSERGGNQRDEEDGWYYGDDGDPSYSSLPFVRNVRDA